MKKIEGIILSAGESVRMGSPKALLELGKKTVIEILIEEYLKSNIKFLTVVLGAYADKIEPLIREKFPRVKIVINDEYKKEMFSSIQKGISSVKVCDGVLIGLIDHPFITSEIINKIIEKFNGANIVIPESNGHRGHPVLLPCFLKKEILQYDPLNYSLREVILNHKESVEYVEVDTDRILFDMDTIEDYERAKKLWRK